MPLAVVGWARRRVYADRTNRTVPGIVEQIRAEAKDHGVTLAHDGEGGIDPRLALAAFRKAKWRCENPFCPTPKKSLDLDHIGGHPREIFEDADTGRRLRRGATAGKKNDKFIHVLCKKCHDAVHQRERAIEDGKQPPPMRGRHADVPA
jgi:hypothetical protein